MVAWGMKYEEVDLSLLYDLLRQQFQNTDDPWVKDTLQWWNRHVAITFTNPDSLSLPHSQVFPTPRDTDNGQEDLRDNEGPTMRELLNAERAGRVSQASAAATNV